MRENAASRISLNCWWIWSLDLIFAHARMVTHGYCKVQYLGRNLKFLAIRYGLCYTCCMKTLSQTNPYLKDKRLAQLSNSISARTSCGVEGIAEHPAIVVNVKPDASKTVEIFKRIQSRLHSS